jgi:hypothetical protein
MFETLDAAREEAGRIGVLRHTVTMIAAGMQTAKVRLKAKEEGLARENAAAEVAERKWKRAFQGAGDADQELTDARHRDALAILRRELRHAPYAGQTRRASRMHLQRLRVPRDLQACPRGR